MGGKFKISVVMPIYNVENYLEESIDSVINQTINFEENIQLILVNDGSPDNSEEICLKYKEKFPDNIIYIKQDNAGVSAARNRGKKEATGKYINFFDSDDIWESNTYQLAFNFLEKNQHKIDLVSCRQEFFGSVTSDHALNFKYEEDAIIDIIDKPNFIQLSASSSIIRLSALNNLDFDTSLAYSEDALLLTQLIIKKGFYGVIKEGIYYYRRREEENSAIQKSIASHEWHFDTTRKSYQYLIDESKKQYGEVSKYIQSYVMYDLQWRLKQPYPENFTEHEKKEYISIITRLLQDIDDDIIFSQKNITSEFKLYALELKYGYKVSDQLTIKNKICYYKNYRIQPLVNRALLRINILEYKEDHIHLEGQIRTILPEEGLSIYIQDEDGKQYKLDLLGNHLDSVQGIDRVVLNNSSFEIKIPIVDEAKFSFYLKYKDYEPIRIKMNFKQHAKLSNDYKLAYFSDNHIIYNTGDFIIKIIKDSPKASLRNRLRTNWDLIKKGKLTSVLLKFYTAISSLFIKKPIWLVSDRLMFANDNGKHLFRYINNLDKKQVNTYFVLNSKSEDYKKMKQIGKVVSYDSLKYKVLFLLSDKIISSSAEDWVINPFKGNREIFKNLYTFDFVFLQHGITKDDLSVWLNKLHKNIKLFVTAAKREKTSIVEGRYGYTENEVKLTGFPRFDNLINKQEKKIIIMPTWRKGLVGRDSKDIPGEREYNINFKDSEYFQFYNQLINHPKLLEVLEEYGYTGEFVIHPSHLKQDKDFNSNQIFSINSGFADYQKYFRESSLLITDYSSVAMDFAYLNKPVIYTQFDRDSFFNQHTYSEGYFDYVRDGFGPVIYNLEDTVTEIITKIKKDCKQEDQYEKRVRDFYKYHDTKNSQRVYRAILEVDN